MAPTQGRHGWLGRLSLANRLLLLAVCATGVVMLAIALMLFVQGRDAAQRTVQREFNASLGLAAQSFKLVLENARAQAESVLPVLESELGGIPVPSGDTITSDAGLDVPILEVDGSMVNANTSSLESLKEKTGAEAAVMVRANEQWVRIATLLRDPQGALMLDSVVPPDDLLARTLDTGEAYSGLVQRNQRWYAMSILPLRDERGAVYGGFSVRVSVAAEVDNLLNVVREMRLAQHGAVGIAQVDATGGWTPALDGGQLLAGLDSERFQLLAALAAGHEQGFGRLPPTQQGAQSLVGWLHMPGWGWALFGAGDFAAFMHDSQQLLLVQVAVMLAGIVVIALLIWLAVRRTLRPLNQVVTVLDQLGKGNLTSRMPAVPARSRNEVHALFSNLALTQVGLAKTIGSVRDTVARLRTAIGDLLAGNTDLSSRTQEQAASLQETAASMEEISATVRQNTDHSRQADAMAGEFAQVARRGEQAVNAVVSTMQNISSSSGQIGEIVQVIEGIAFQTNILALNAAVEAARAGDEGRGFAVVAAEVRALAQRSATAAGEIKALIEASVSQVGAGVQEVERAGNTMAELLQAVDRMTQLMRDIASASEEQATGIGEINRAIAQMDAVTQQNAALVQQAAASVGALSSQADALTAAVDVFVTQARQQDVQDQDIRVMEVRALPELLPESATA